MQIVDQIGDGGLIRFGEARIDPSAERCLVNALASILSLRDRRFDVFRQNQSHVIEKQLIVGMTVVLFGIAVFTCVCSALVDPVDHVDAFIGTGCVPSLSIC